MYTMYNACCSKSNVDTIYLPVNETQKNAKNTIEATVLEFQKLRFLLSTALNIQNVTESLEFKKRNTNDVKKK